VLHCVALCRCFCVEVVCCTVLHRVAVVCRSVLQRLRVCGSLIGAIGALRVAVCCRVLQCVAVCCSVLRWYVALRVALCCRCMCLFFCLGHCLCL